MSRTENGSPILRTASGLDVVAFDAIAKLSGVSGGAVVKVLAAINAIDRYDVSEPLARPRAIVDFDNVPTAQPNESRARATTAYCADLADKILCPIEGDAELASVLNPRRLL